MVLIWAVQATSLNGERHRNLPSCRCEHWEVPGPSCASCGSCWGLSPSLPEGRVLTPSSGGRYRGRGSFAILSSSNKGAARLVLILRTLFNSTNTDEAASPSTVAVEVRASAHGWAAEGEGRHHSTDSSGMLFSHQIKQDLDFYTNTDEPRKRCVQWGKSDTGTQRAHPFLSHRREYNCVYNMLEKLLEGEDGEMLVRGRKLQRRVGFNLLLHNRVIVVNSNVSPISK